MVRERYAWYVVFVLLLAYTCSFVDRMILTLLLRPIRLEFGVSDTEVSLLIGFAFAIFYTFFGLPLGWLADRGSRRIIIIAGVLMWSVATAACGLATSFSLLFAARVAVGIGEAALSPAAYSMMADYFPPERLGRAIAVYSIGVPFGSGLALILGGIVVQWADRVSGNMLIFGQSDPWRLVFLLVSLPGLVVAALMLTVREPARSGAGAKQRVAIGDGIAFVKSHAALFIPFFGGLSLLTLVMYGAMAWMPTFFARTYGVPVATAALWFGVILSVGGVIGLLGGGWLADRLYAGGRRDGHILTLLVAVIGSTPFFVLAPLMPSPKLAIAGVAVAMTVSAMHGGVAGAVLQIVTPNRLRGQITALYLFVANLIGFGCGATIIALVTDHVFGHDNAIRYSLAAVAAVALPISAICLAAARRPYQHLTAID